MHLDNIQKIIQQNLPIQYNWIDAEWYGQGGWPVNVGSWQFKKDLYPQGFKPLSDALRASGRELMLWFEPERVYKGTTWHKEHPEWLLDAGGDSLLLNLGNPEARKFVTDFISDRITEFGLGCYRQDFNIDPLGFWQRAERWFNRNRQPAPAAPQGPSPQSGPAAPAGTHRQLPVVLSTAYGSFKDDFSSWLADAYVVKSGNLRELKSEVARVLERRYGGDRPQ